LSISREFSTADMRMQITMVIILMGWWV